MRPNTTASILLFLSVAATPIQAREIDLEKPSSQLRRFVSDVIFEVEAGDREKYSKRLPEHVAVEFFGQAGPKPVAEKHLSEFFQISGVKRIDKPVEGQRSAKIEIYFGSQDELSKTAKELDGQITLARGFTYWTWWDEDKTINRAVVLVATDKVSGPALEDRLIEQFFGVFGIPARSKEFDESCLSSEDAVLTNLQPVDKALLEFYYRAVPPGTKPRNFDKLFREEWKRKRLQAGHGATESAA